MAKETADTHGFSESKQYGMVYSNKFMPTPIGRIQFPYLVKPNEYQGKKSWSVTICFPKTGGDLSGLMAIEQVVKHMKLVKYGDPNFVLDIDFVRDGDLEKYEGYAGNWYIRASAKYDNFLQGVPVVGPDAKKNIDPAQVVSGVECILLVKPKLSGVYPHVQGKPKAAQCVSYDLECVQFVRDDGTRYKAGPDVRSFLTAITPFEAISEDTPNESFGASMLAASIDSTPIIEEQLIPVAPETIIIPGAKAPSVMKPAVAAPTMPKPQGPKPVGPVSRTKMNINNAL